MIQFKKKLIFLWFYYNILSKTMDANLSITMKDTLSIYIEATETKHDSICSEIYRKFGYDETIQQIIDEEYAKFKIIIQNNLIHLIEAKIIVDQDYFDAINEAKPLLIKKISDRCNRTGRVAQQDIVLPEIPELKTLGPAPDELNSYFVALALEEKMRSELSLEDEKIARELENQLQAEDESNSRSVNVNIYNGNNSHNDDGNDEDDTHNHDHHHGRNNHKHTTIKFSDLEREANKKQCTICLEDYKATDSITVLKCAHAFHSVCIKKWNKKTCPFCRS